jgi:hypothetical protein
MKRVFLLFIITIWTLRLQAQIALLYTDTTVQPGTAITLGVHLPVAVTYLDDAFSQTVPIGFPFNFFDSVYNYGVISGNNVFSFDTMLAGDLCSFEYNTGKNAGSFNRAILFPFQDLQLSSAQNRRYITHMNVGAAPNRRFIVDFCNANLYFCDSSLLVNDQIILSEGSNSIDMNIKSKPVCTNWMNGTAVQGIKNGNTEVYVAGRNAPQIPWTATEESRRFISSGTGYNINTIAFQYWHILDSIHAANIEWYNENNVFLGTGVQQIVTPGINTHFYTARYTGTTGCGTTVYTFVDTVHVQVPDTVTPVGIDEADAEAFRSIVVYPNPVKDIVTVKGTKNNVRIQSIDLINTLGVTVFRKQIDYNTSVTISFGNILPGVYYLKIKTDRGFIFKKIQHY